jgi:hypothetical protein
VPQGYIDASSLYEIVHVFRYPNPEAAYPWAVQSSIEVTALLMEARNIELAPDPGPAGATSGPYEVLTTLLSSFVRKASVPATVRQKALRQTQAWVQRNPAEIQSAYRALGADRTNFDPWLESFVTHDWVEHSARLGGLFDSAFIPELSRVLEVPTTDLLRAHEESRGLAHLPDHAEHRGSNDLSRLICDAFVVSSLLRGRYHENAALLAQLQLHGHPFRRSIQVPAPSGQATTVEVANTARAIATIVLMGAYTERGLDARIRLWAENVRCVREAVAAERIELGSRRGSHAAQEAAVAAAKVAGVRVHPRILERGIDAVIGVGAAVLSSFVLVGWEAVAASVAVSAASTEATLGQHIARRVASGPWRLRTLVNATPGRLDGSWSIPSPDSEPKDQ